MLSIRLNASNKFKMPTNKLNRNTKIDNEMHVLKNKQNKLNFAHKILQLYTSIAFQQKNIL